MAIAATLLALTVPLALIYFTSLPAASIYLIQLAVFILAAIVLSLPPIRYRIVPKRRMRDARTPRPSTSSWRTAST